MLDTSMLKSLLRHEFYLENKSRINKKLFADEIRSLYGIITEAHEKYQHDLTPKELMALWELDNPVATTSDKAYVQDLIRDIDAQTEFSPDIAADVITQLWQRDVGKRLANIALEISQGNPYALKKAQEIFESIGQNFIDDEFGPDTTQDIDELKHDMDDSKRAKFNISTLSRHIYGVQSTDFGIIFATPETGKTAFVVSLAVAPGGFVDQGYRVAILGNEESTRKTVVRAYSAATGLTRKQILEDTEKAKMVYHARTQNMVSFKDTQDWDLDKIESYIQSKKADVVFIDQADKVQISGNYNAGHERLRELYRRLRETAKRCECAIFAISQASAEAEGRTRLSYTMMEGSKIGKAAEADLIMGIGRHDTEEDDHLRFITVSKNKISGWHGTEVVTIKPEISRYVE